MPFALLFHHKYITLLLPLKTGRNHTNHLTENMNGKRKGKLMAYQFNKT